MQASLQNKIEEMQSLKDGWVEGAHRIRDDAIKKAKYLVSALPDPHLQTLKVFPNTDGDIDFVWGDRIFGTFYEERFHVTRLCNGRDQESVELKYEDSFPSLLQKLLTDNP